MRKIVLFPVLLLLYGCDFIGSTESSNKKRPPKKESVSYDDPEREFKRLIHLIDKGMGAFADDLDYTGRKYLDELYSSYYLYEATSDNEIETQLEDLTRLIDNAYGAWADGYTSKEMDYLDKAWSWYCY